MVRLGALSGRGEVLIGGIPHGQVHYAIEECHQGGLGGRRGHITGDDKLLRAIWDQAFEVQLASAAGPIAIAMTSYVIGRGSAEVAVGGPVGSDATSLAAA